MELFQKTIAVIDALPIQEPCFNFIRYYLAKTPL